MNRQHPRPHAMGNIILNTITVSEIWYHCQNLLDDPRSVNIISQSYVQNVADIYILEEFLPTHRKCILSVSKFTFCVHKMYISLWIIVFIIWSGFVLSMWLCETSRLVSKHWYEPVHEISNNVVCATSKASDKPAHTCSLITAFASRLSNLWLFSYWLNTSLSF